MFKTKLGREISFLGEENANEIRCIEKMIMECRHLLICLEYC